MPEHRIVSLIASATEIVAALGLRPQLVGRSHECDYPPDVVELPACSEPKIDIHGTSREIDERVKSVLRDATSVYRVFTEVLDELAPTVVITQTQCEVCAVSLQDVERAVCEMVSSRPKLVACEPNALADVWNDFRNVAAALDVPDRGEQLVNECLTRLNRVAADVRRETHRPRIGCIEWIDPLKAAGNWVPELVEIAGGVNVFGEAGKHSPWMAWEDLLREDPEVLAILPCGFDMSRCLAEMPVLTGDPRWSRLSAVRNHRVYITDGNQFFNRPGPRVVESAEILAEILYPGRFDYGHEGTGWIALEPNAVG